MTKIIALLSLLLFACSSADGPIMAEDLHGTWCGYTDVNEETCLIVDFLTTPVTYIWYVGDPLGNATCSETGALTGGLEFTPADGSDLCLAPESALYSAGGSWTDSGLRLELDTTTGQERANGNQPQRVLELDYRH